MRDENSELRPNVIESERRINILESQNHALQTEYDKYKMTSENELDLLKGHLMQFQNTANENEQLQAKIRELKDIIRNYENEMEDSNNGITCIYIYILLLLLFDYSIEKEYN